MFTLLFMVGLLALLTLGLALFFSTRLGPLWRWRMLALFSMIGLLALLALGFAWFFSHRPEGAFGR